VRSCLFPIILVPLASLGAQAQTNAQFLVHAQAQARAQTPARELVSSAVKDAASKDKKVLALFTASWCQWCKRLKTTIEAPDAKKAMEDHFSALWLTVNERGDSKALENEGADALLTEWAGGGRPGIPFMAILGADEKPIATSIRAIKPGDAPGNIGFPGDDEERDAFLAFLKVGAPNLTEIEGAAIRKALGAAMDSK
jgi:thiol-disulfide isomerase/thioredoxin